jgi:hypothetical protein
VKASAVIRARRSLGNWLAYALPDDHEDDTRSPDPPEKKEAQRPSCAPGEQPTPATTTTTHVLP